MKKSLLIAFLGCIFLSGCGFVTEKLPLNYEFNKSAGMVYQIKQNQKIAVNVDDKRDINDPKFIMHKVGAGPQLSGGYIAEKPIVDIVKSAISSGLQQMNLTISIPNDSRYDFNCDINSIESKLIMGFANCTSVIEINIHGYLFDKRTKKIVWQEIVTGRGKITYAWQTDNDLRNAFNSALTDLVWKIQNSRTFRMAF